MSEYLIKSLCHLPCVNTNLTRLDRWNRMPVLPTGGQRHRDPPNAFGLPCEIWAKRGQRMWSTLGQLLRVRERGTKREEEEKNRQISFHRSLFLNTIASKTGAFSFLSPTETGDGGHPFVRACVCVRPQTSHACATQPARLPCITPLWHAINQDKSQNPRGDGSFLHTAWLKSKIYEATESVSMLGSWLSKRIWTRHFWIVLNSISFFMSCSKSRS